MHSSRRTRRRAELGEILGGVGIRGDDSATGLDRDGDMGVWVSVSGRN